MITRPTDVLLKRKNKKRLILDVDSTEDPARGNQNQMVYNGRGNVENRIKEGKNTLR